ISRVPPHEILENLHAGVLALLRMELDAEDVVFRHRRGEARAVVAAREHVVSMRRAEVIAVHEVERELTGLEPGEQGMFGPKRDIVPTHMRNLHLIETCIEPHDLARNPTEAIVGAV